MTIRRRSSRSSASNESDAAKKPQRRDQTICSVTVDLHAPTIRLAPNFGPHHWRVSSWDQQSIEPVNE